MKADQKAKNKIEGAKIDLLLNFPFFGVLSSKLPFVEVKSIASAATDYKRIYYNPDFMNSLSHDECMFVIAHELCHCIYNHFIRQNNRHHEYWNMACDYVINYDLVHEQYQKRDGTHFTGVGTIRKDWLYDPKFKGMASEKVYEILMKTQPPILPTLDVHGPGDSSGKNGDKNESGSANDTDDGDGNGAGTDCDAGKSGESGKKSEGEGEGKNGKTPGGSGDQTSDPEVMDSIPEMTEEEIQQAVQEFEKAVIDTSSTCCGSVPGNIKRVIDELKNPKMNWRQVIRTQIESKFKSNKSWITPHRRSWTQGFIMPGPAPDKSIDVAIAIDTSGSISDEEARDFLSEVTGIMQQFKQHKISIWTFDHTVKKKSFVQFTEADNFNISSFKALGGGGTNFEINWEFMKKMKIKPDKFIMFTDGYAPLDQCDKYYVDTIWLIHSNPDFKPPFGLKIDYDSK